MSNLVAPHLRDKYFSWEGVVKGLFPMYSTGSKRRKYEIWFMSVIYFISSLAEAAVTEVMWQIIWIGTSLIRLGGVSCL